MTRSLFCVNVWPVNPPIRLPSLPSATRTPARGSRAPCKSLARVWLPMQDAQGDLRRGHRRGAFSRERSPPGTLAGLRGEKPPRGGRWVSRHHHQAHHPGPCAQGHRNHRRDAAGYRAVSNSKFGRQAEQAQVRAQDQAQGPRGEHHRGISAQRAAGLAGLHLLRRATDLMDFHVQRGEPIRAELWNALVDALGQAQIFPGQGIRRRVFDGRTMLSADRVPRTGNSATPYILGSTKYGSSMSGPHAHDDPPKGGGFADVPTARSRARRDGSALCCIDRRRSSGRPGRARPFRIRIYPPVSRRQQSHRQVFDERRAGLRPGYPWTAIRVTRRADYLAALEEASTRGALLRSPASLRRRCQWTGLKPRFATSDAVSSVRLDHALLADFP